MAYLDTTQLKYCSVGSRVSAKLVTPILISPAANAVEAGIPAKATVHAAVIAAIL